MPLPVPTSLAELIYQTGTITLTNGLAAFTGSGTTWLGSADAPVIRPGDWLVIAGFPAIPIDEITGNGAGDLVHAWPHASQAGVPYIIIKSSFYRVAGYDFAVAITRAVQSLAAASIVHWFETAPPDPNVGELGQYGIVAADGAIDLYYKEDATTWVAATQNLGTRLTGGIPFNFLTTTTDADQAAGSVWLNHASFMSASKLFVDNAAIGGGAVTAWLDTFDDGGSSGNRGHVKIVNAADESNWMFAKVTGSIVDKTGYREIPITPQFIVGSAFANGTAAELFFQPKGDTGSASSSADVAWTGDISPSSLSADQNDYNPSGLSGAAVIRHAASAEVAITGLQGGADGRLMVHANVSAHVLKKPALRLSSSAANRFAGSDIEIDPGMAGLDIYDGTSNLWRPFAPRLKPLHLHSHPFTIPHQPVVYGDWSRFPWMDPYWSFTNASGNRTFYDRNGVMRYAPAGVLRFDTDWATGYRGVRTEGSKQNLLLRSNEFDNAYWTKTGITPTADGATGPDETVTADVLTEDGGNSVHGIDRAVSVTAGSSYTGSIHVERLVGTRWFVIQHAGASGSAIAYFDPATGAVGFVGTTGAYTNATAGVRPLPDGRWRFWLRCTIVTDTTVFVRYRYAQADAGSTTYTGDGASAMAWFGAQFELGALTSYIPTTTATVTRAADIFQRSNADGALSLSKYTLLAEGMVDHFDATVVLASLGTNDLTDRASLYISSLAVPGIFVSDGGVTQANFALNAYTPSTMIRMAMAQRLNSVRGAANGTLQGTPDPSNTVPTIFPLTIGATSTAGGTGSLLIKRVALWPRDLPDTQFAAVTA
ncbi:MAG: hypothetical protein AB7V13_08350 [Pseudorhodoplanes sp.]|uniref:phage head spike fiber domain-containing protein n=1 Tax=Pseudorhodoplanes sp. TaxID=1934341 RepID=UPI003D10E9B1